MHYLKISFVLVFLLLLVPIVAAQDDAPTENYTGEVVSFDLTALVQTRGRDSVLLQELATEYNVCEDAIMALNPEWQAHWERNPYMYPSFTPQDSMPSSIIIPLDSPACFETVEIAAGQSVHQFAESINVCEKVIYDYNGQRLFERSNVMALSLFIPLDILPCYENGQRLVYTAGTGMNLDNPIYVDASPVVLGDGIVNLYEYARKEGYCPFDLYPLNIEYTAFGAGDTLYIPNNVRHCDYITEIGRTSLEISRSYNVCLEVLNEMNGGLNSWSVIVDRNATIFHYDRSQYHGEGIFVPTDMPPCYAENGLRVGENDRAVHETSRDEWLFQIAQEYQVCLQDLFETNPLLDTYPYTPLPSLIFIPDVAPCSYTAEANTITVRFPLQPTANYGNIQRGLEQFALMFNVCSSTIQAANPNGFSRLESNYAEIRIPANQEPCFDFYAENSGTGHYRWQNNNTPSRIAYVCYAEAIDLTTDYAGHDPVISPIEKSDDAHCYDIQATPQVVIANQTYTLYPYALDAPITELADCFGVSAYDIATIRAEDLQLKVKPFASYWGVQNPSQACPLVTGNAEEIQTWKRQYYALRAYGELNEAGIYTVTYGDTLSAIGHRYGYLPQWIQDANNLPNTTLYDGQSLTMPSFPNLYQLGIGGGIGAGFVLSLGLGTFILRLRGNGRKGKKKRE